jgi:hypothetical protein
MSMNPKALTDLHLAAYLAMRGHRLIGIEANRERTVFVFEPTVALEKDTLTFFNRKASVEPLAYAEQLRHFKAIAVSGGRRG